MNSKEILELARNNKYDGKEYENKKTRYGFNLGLSISTILGTIMVFVEFFTTGIFNFALVAVVSVPFAVSYFYEGIKFKRTLLTIFGAIWIIWTCLFVILFICQVV